MRCGIETSELLHQNDSIILEGDSLYEKLDLATETSRLPIKIDSDEPLTDGFIVNRFYSLKYKLTNKGGNEISKDVQIRVIIC